LRQPNQFLGKEEEKKKIENKRKTLKQKEERIGAARDAISVATFCVFVCICVCMSFFCFFAYGRDKRRCRGWFVTFPLHSRELVETVAIFYPFL
jgi:hypothetical protein